MTRRAWHRTLALTVIAAVLVLFALAFFGVPGGSSYRIRAVFSDVNQLPLGARVRIAGVDVGQVTAISRAGVRGALVTMEIDDNGRPIHTDALLRVRPRLVLEGNAYVELRPGTPSAPVAKSAHMFPASQTAVTPQLDQVLDVFDGSTRTQLHGFIREFGAGLRVAPPHEQSGAVGLRGAVRELDDALDAIGTASSSARGTTRGGIRRALRATSMTARQLAADPAALSELVTNARRTTGALAGEDRKLGQSIRGLARVTSVARPALLDLDRALEPTTTLVKQLRPALAAAPRSLRSANALVRQVRRLVRPAELGGVVSDLRPVAGRLPGLVKELRTTLQTAIPVVNCINSNVTPTLKMTIDPKDGYPHVTGDPVWLELMHSFTGFSSIASSVDANGGNARLGLAGGEQALQGVIPDLGRVVGLGIPKNILGVRPKWLGYGVNPPYRPDAPCAEQRLPDLNQRGGSAPRFTPLSAAPRGGR